MDKTAIQTLTNHFDGLSHTLPEDGIEFWFARELQETLGYAKWERFKDVIYRAMTSCETTGFWRCLAILPASREASHRALTLCQ